MSASIFGSGNMPENNLEVSAFSQIKLADLDALSKDEIDKFPFGVVGLSPDGIVEVYNASESKLAGLPADTVIGSHFFLNTAQCMNNFMVAQRFEDELEIDAIIDFVLTFRMRPTPVRLRLLKSVEVARRYILIER